MYNRRKRKNFVAWIPVILAGILIIAAFVIAPSLLPSAPRGSPTSSVSGMSRLPASARVEEPTPPTATEPDGALPERRPLPPDRTPAPAGPGTRQGSQAGDRRAPPPEGEGMATAPTGVGARRGPQTGYRRAPAPEGMAATPVDEWSGPQGGERRTPAPEAMAGVPTDAGSRKISQADERWGESPTETSAGATQRAPNAVNAAPEPQDDASDDLSVRWNQ